jgi:beta-lactamase regulating signal transducer with metallopeptidase domain
MTPDLSFWKELFVRLAVEAACVVTVAWLMERLVRPVFWRRTLWQGAVVCLLLLTGSELSGFGRGVAAYFFDPARPQPKPIVLTRPPEQPRVVLPSPLPLSPPPLSFAPAPIAPAFVAVAPEIFRPVCWPGLLWLAGGLVVLGRALAAQILFIPLRRQRLNPDCEDLHERVAAIRRRLALRREICLLQSPGLTAPIAFGVLRPSVVLPVDFAAKFSRAEQDAMLAHELAHLAAWDPFWYMLADVSSAALWWHPQTWWARRRLHRASEVAADEAAAIFPQGPAALAECLVTLGRQMTRLPRGNFIGVEGGGFRSNLGERVQRLLHLAGTARPPSYGWRAHAARLAAITAISASALTLSCCLQNRGAAPQPTLQANLSQSWNDSPAAAVWQSVRPVKRPETPPQPELVKVQLVKAEESVVDKSGQLAYPDRMFSEMIRVLESRRIEATLDYNDHSNTLSILHTLQDQGKLDQGITKFWSEQADQDLFSRVSSAQDNLVHAQEEHGRESDQYIAAQKAYNEATNSYHVKAMGIMTHWESIVEHDRRNLDFISDEKTQQIKVSTNVFRQALWAKLQSIQLPDLDFGQAGIPLSEGLYFLKDQVKKHDPDKKEINFIYNSHAGDGPTAGSVPADAKDITVRISPPLKKLSLFDALEAVCLGADLPPGASSGGLRYTISDYGIVFYFKSAQAGSVYYTRIYHEEPHALLAGLREIFPEFAPDTNSATTEDYLRDNALLRQYFASRGIQFTNDSGYSLWNPNTGSIMLHATAPDMATLQRAIEDLAKVPHQPSPELREQDGEKQVASGENSSARNSSANTNLAGVSAGRQAILAKLNYIRFSEVSYGEGGLPLSEVMSRLTDESRKRDLEGKGIGFSYHSPADGYSPAGATPVEAKDITVRISPPLQDLSLFDALDAICQVADLPPGAKGSGLGYTIGDDSIWFYVKPPISVPLYTRMFHVDPNTFIKGLAGVKSAVVTNSANGTGSVRYDGGAGSSWARTPDPYVTAQANTSSTNVLIRDFFKTIGVNLATNDGKFVYFNDRAGTILVKASALDLEKVATAIELLNEVPPQVTLDVKFATIPETSYKILGLDMPGPYLIPFDPGTNDNVLQTGLYIGKMTTTNPFMVVGILHNSQFHKIINAINQIDASALLSWPRVTTESAHPAHLDTSNAVSAVKNPVVVSNPPTYGYSVSSEPYFNRGVDILPTLSVDGYSIQTVVIPSVSEFVGYDNPGAFVPAATSVGNSSIGVPITAILPLPHYRVRQSVVSTNIFDGDTLVLGASLPQYDPNEQIELIFVTPRIVHPDNSPVHSDEDLPRFAPAKVEK